MQVYGVRNANPIVIMKLHIPQLLVAAGLLFGLVACSAKHTVKTEKLTAALASASGDVKTHGDAAVAAIKTENYEEAVTAIAKLEGLELSDAFKAAVVDALVDIQTILTEKGGSDELIQKVQETSMKFY
jgi:hypothetical protein